MWYKWAVSVLYYNVDVIRVLCDISMRPFRFAFNHLSWGHFGQHHDSWGRFGEAVSACPPLRVGAVSVEAVSGGAVLVMSYFGAVWVEAVSEWGRFDQLPTAWQGCTNSNTKFFIVICQIHEQLKQVCYRNWPWWCLRWSGLCCYSGIAWVSLSIARPSGQPARP